MQQKNRRSFPAAFRRVLSLTLVLAVLLLSGCGSSGEVQTITIPDLTDQHFYTPDQPGIQTPYFPQEMAQWIQDPQPLQVYESSQENLREEFSLPELDRSSKGALSPDGKYLLVTTETQVSVYSTQSGRCLATREDSAASHFVWLSNNLLGVAWGQDQGGQKAVRVYNSNLKPALTLGFSTGQGDNARFATGITYNAQHRCYILSFALAGEGTSPNWGNIGLSLWSDQGNKLVELDTNIPCQTLSTGTPAQQTMLTDSYGRVFLQGWNVSGSYAQTYWFDLEKNQNQPIGAGVPLGLQEDILLVASGDLYSQTSTYVVTAYRLEESAFSMLFHLRDPSLQALNSQCFRIYEMIPSSQEGVVYLRAMIWNQALPYSVLLEHKLGDKFSFQLVHTQPISHLLCGLTPEGNPLWISRDLSPDYAQQLQAQQTLSRPDVHELLDQRIHPLSVGAVLPFSSDNPLDDQEMLDVLARYVSALLVLDGQTVPQKLVLSPEQVEELAATLFGRHSFEATETSSYDKENKVYRLAGVDLSQTVQQRTVYKLPQFTEMDGTPACILNYSYTDSNGETTSVEEVYFLSSFQQDACIVGITRMVSNLPAQGGSPSP